MGELRARFSVREGGKVALTIPSYSYYPGLCQSVPDYPGLYRIPYYARLSRTIPDYFRLFWTIPDYPVQRGQNMLEFRCVLDVLIYLGCFPKIDLVPYYVTILRPSALSTSHRVRLPHFDHGTKLVLD